MTPHSHGGNVLRMTNATRNFKSIGPDLWESTDGSEIIISLNGTGTMVTVQSPTKVEDFMVETTAQNALISAIAYARSI